MSDSTATLAARPGVSVADTAAADLARLPAYVKPPPGLGGAEIFIYFGNACNRACEFCVVDGRPGGWYGGLPDDAVDFALRFAGSDGVIKIYGGEPTLFADDVLTAIRRMRAGGFRGHIAVFTNGVQARTVTELLESDARTVAVLNYSIATGRYAPVCPEPSRRVLLDYAARTPDRIFLGHSSIRMYAPLDTEDATTGECARCAPALVTGSDPFVHACPFATENLAPHYRLGGLDAAPETIGHNHAEFLRWVDDVLHPEARRRELHPCLVCAGHVAELPLPRYLTPETAPTAPG